MSEKHSPERQYIASQIRSFREKERSGALEKKWLNRTGTDYIYELRGLKHLFDYVRTLPSHKVLDIGAGTTKGIADIANSNFGRDLQFEATVLYRNQKEIEKNLGKNKTHSTSAEVLRGSLSNPMNSESYGAILSVMSITYTKDPEKVIKRINDLLIPGGVFKGDFNNKDNFNRAGDMLSPQHFARVFSDLGYKENIDFYYKNVESENLDNAQELYDNDILIAIKPNPTQPNPISAKELYEEDWNNINKASNILKKNSSEE